MKNEERLQEICNKYEEEVKNLITKFIGDFSDDCDDNVRDSIIKSGGHLMGMIYKNFSTIFGLSFEEDLLCINSTFGALLASLQIEEQIERLLENKGMKIFPPEKEGRA